MTDHLGVMPLKQPQQPQQQPQQTLNFNPSFDTNGIPLMLTWSIADVGAWVRDGLGFPQYEQCFVSNHISGRKLITIDTSTLPKIGITDYQHIRFISQKIRDLLGIEMQVWDRSISLPPREPVSHFLERKSHTGQESDALTFPEHLRYLRKYNDHE